MDIVENPQLAYPYARGIRVRCELVLSAPGHTQTISGLYTLPHLLKLLNVWTKPNPSLESLIHQRACISPRNMP